MIKISPSVLAADITKLGEQIATVEKASDMLHLDIMDGHFVPNLSFGTSVVKGIRGITKKCLDTHLMIDNPLKYIEPFAAAGSDIITVHVEAPDDIAACLKLIHKLGKKSGIALNPDTSPTLVEKYLDDADMVLQMTVFPGFGGQGMVTQALSNLPTLRKMMGGKDLEVDGGIYADNVELVAAAGANVIVSGTGIFGQSSPEKSAEEIRRRAASVWRENI